MSEVRDEASELEARLSAVRAERMRRRMRVITIIALVYWVAVFVFADGSLHSGQASRAWLRGAQCLSCVVFLWWLRRPHSLRSTEAMGVAVGAFGALMSSIGSVAAPEERRGPIIVSVLLAVAVEAPVLGLSAPATMVWFALTVGMLTAAILAGPSGVHDPHLLWIAVTTLAYGVLILHAVSRDRLERAEFFARSELTAANRRLAEHDAARSRLFLNLSHDFRTPLALIRGEVDLLRRDALIAAGAAPALGRIVANVTAMTDLTEQLLELARLDLGSVPYHPAVFDLRAVARDVTALHRPAAGTVSVTAEVPADPVRVLADRGHTRRVLANLVANALRATARQGTHVTLRVGRDGERAVVDVTDDGCGIPPERRARVFERFASFDAEGSTVSGIGLALARELANINGGELRLLDTTGQTVFRFSLPATTATLDVPASDAAVQEAAVQEAAVQEAAVQEATVQEATENPVREMPRSRVLVVEDNAELRGLLERALGAVFELTFAEDARAARSALTTTSLDAMLCDVLLPDGNGYDLVTAVRASPAHRGLAVVLLSALGDPEERARGMALGADDYLSKPFATLELIARITAAIARHADRQRALAEQRDAFLMEVHDGVSASLVRAAVLLVAHQRALGPAAARQPQLDDALGAIREGLAEARALLSIRGAGTPRPFEDVVGDVRHEVSTAAEAAGLAITFRSATDGTCDRISAPAEHAIRRIAREAMTNVVKHARARCVTCSLEGRQGGLFIRVEDDGAGMKAVDDGRHGLSNIERRARSLRGRARHGTGSAGGAFVEAWIEA